MKKLIVYTEPGHAGIALENDDGSFTRYDFGSSMAGGEYQKLNGTFNKLVSIGAVVTMAAAYTLAGGAAAETIFPNDIIANCTGVLSGIYALACMPVKGALVKKNHRDHLKATYTKETAHVFEITDAQRDACYSAAEKSKKDLYCVGVSNCSDFTKKIMRKAGIKTSRRLINTPKSLTKQLHNMSIVS